MPERAATAFCLDITRLVSRTGKGPHTGIDRVELAYLDGLLARDTPLFGLARTAAGYVLLDRAGLSSLRGPLADRSLTGGIDVIGLLSRRLAPQRRQAEAELRRRSMARCLRPRLGALLSRHLPPGTVYLNVGHSNLSDAVLKAVKSVPQARSAVLIHDTIPLDLPQTQRPGTPEVFAQRLAAVARHADTVICTTDATAESVESRLITLGRVPQIVTARLGIDLAQPDAGTLALPNSPYFLCIGTIDPRKNQSFLLDLWEALPVRMPGNVPTLILAGSRGWGDAPLMQRLDAAPINIVEMPGLGDNALAALMTGAAAVLHPSLTEGFGFPPLEAALRGIPVICPPLPVYRELLGDIPVYAPSGDLYHWTNAIEALMGDDNNRQTGTRASRDRPTQPTWTTHLNLVLNRL